MVPSRKASQVRSHAQKFISKLFFKFRVKQQPNLKAVKFMKFPLGDSRLKEIQSANLSEEALEELLLGNFVASGSVNCGEVVRKSQKSAQFKKLSKIFEVTKVNRQCRRTNLDLIDLLGYDKEYEIGLDSEEFSEIFDWRTELPAKQLYAA